MRRRVAGSVALTGISQIAVMVLGGVLAILLAARVGSNAKTDGLFAAYGVYAIVVLLAQSARMTIVPRLLDSPTRFGAFDAYLGATLVTFLVAGVIFVPLGGPFSTLLTGSLPDQAQHTARVTLLILWPATGFQLFAALSASMLGVIGNYLTAALAYASGGVASVIAFLVLYSGLGVNAVPAAILIGAAVTALPLLVALMRAGWRPGWRAIFDWAGAVRRAAMIAVASAPVLLLQILYLVSVAFVSRIGTGDVTAFTYAFFTLGLVIALTASSVSIVLAAPLAATWDRDPESLRPHVDDVLRAGLLLLMPVLAGAAFLGKDIAGTLLASFSDHDIDQIVNVFLVLSPAVVAYQALAIPIIALFALGRYGATSLITLPVIVLHAGLSLAGYEIGGLTATAAAVPVSVIVFALALLALLHGNRFPGVVVRLTGELLRVGLPAAACFGAGALVSSGPVGYIAGILLYIAVLVLFMPVHRALIVRVARSLRMETEATHV